MAKITEAIVKEYLEEHMEVNHILDSTQLGFRRRLGALQQAAHFHAIVKGSMRPRKRVIATLLDVAKAYDKV